MWQTVGSISTGLALVAFAIAALLTAYRSKLNNRANVIKSLPEKDRGSAVEQELNAFGIRAEGLSPDARYQIALKEIGLREKKLKYIFIVAIVAAVLATAIAIVSIVTIFLGNPKQRQNQTSSQPQTITRDGPNVTFGCEEGNKSTVQYTAPDKYHITDANATIIDSAGAKNSNATVNNRTKTSVSATAEFMGRDREFMNCPGGGHGAVKLTVEIAPD